MKHRVRIAVIGSVLLLGIAHAQADADFIKREEAAIGELAGLNATALACKDMDSVHRIKQAIIYGVPKLREYGDTFEEATNAAYLEIAKTGVQCPSPAAMTVRIDAAVQRIETVFAPYKK